MNKILSAVIILICLCVFNSFAQDAKIIGKVYDGSSGGVLPDAVVKVEGTNKGTASDLDGAYVIEGVKAGEHVVKATYVGYISQSVSVNVKPGEVITVDVILKPEGTTIDTVTIEAERIMNNEATLLLKQQKSENIQDGISSQQIKRTADATSSDVLKRVVGVSIVDNKFVYVRGTNERYSSTTLNGVILPSTDPDKKAFSFDLFPSNLLENIIISKSYTPDLVGNFSGGLVQVTTKEFPEKLSVNFSLSSSYSLNTTGDNFLTYNAGETKFGFLNLGRDNGSRELPGIIPGQTLISSNFSAQDIKTFSRSFANNWKQEKTTAPLNGGFQLSIGNNIAVGKKNNLGFFGAYTYSNSFNTKTIERQSFQTDQLLTSKYTGSLSEYAVTWGGLLNLSFRAGENNKFSFKNTYVFNSEDETEYQEGFNNPQTQDRQLYANKFVEREVLSSQISGEHYIKTLSKLRITWKGSYSESDRNEPDYKTLRYQRELGTTDRFFASIGSVPNSAGGGRFFSKLKDINRGFESNFELAFKFIKNSELKTKFGVFYNRSSRDFNARLFAPILADPNNFPLIYLSIDSLLTQENIDTNKFLYDEITRESDKYSASNNLSAGYFMFDIPVGKLRTVIGARLESNLEKLNSVDQTGNPVNRNINKNDILPSVNLTYALNDKMNIRAGYYQSISRPEFREVAPFSFYDFQEQIFTIGNPELERNLIRNYDLRYEVFPNPGEIMSLSLFYKKFDSPIEEVFVPSSGSDNRVKTFQNVKGGAENYGVELELRKNLGFISKNILKDFSVNANVSIINSKVDLSGIGSTATNIERRLQGQSPYTVNLGLYYDNSKLGTSVNVSYNRFGKRISEVGLEGLPDIEENGRDVVDITVIQKLFKNFEVKLSIKDLIASDYLFTQVINGKDETYKKLNAGTGFSIGLSFKY